ncbi:AGAP013203-PA-like protein [Anopheles sinensis]|uniref:AGAP013203-PA-like protein n=1 Tax=Anopheles sinensis TaxID=74873 RepID=A0A084VVS9_ANOSI|nr:AGAP013203-PA-like protein [Anopheles sinensis]
MPADMNLVPTVMPFGKFNTNIRMYNKRNQTMLAIRPFWMKRFECMEQPYRYTKILSCQMESHRGVPQMVHVVANVTQLLSKVFISTELYAKHKQSQTFIYGTSFEYCEFMTAKDSKLNPVAVALYNYAKHNFPQVLKECPIMGIFNVSNLLLDRNLIPPLVTPGLYICSQRFYTKRNETVLHYIAEFSVGAPSIFNKMSQLIHCRVWTHREEAQIVDVLLDIREPISKLTIAYKIYTQYFHTRNLLYGTEFEYCDFVKSSDVSFNPVAQIALNLAKDNFPEIVKPCPVQGLINVTSLRVVQKLLPPYAPPGAYYFDIRASNKRNQTIIACASEFTVVQKSLINQTLSMLG